jgi:hypothetical protein
MHCNERISLAPGAETYCQLESGHAGPHEVLESQVPARTYAQPKQMPSVPTSERGMDGKPENTRKIPE